MQFNTFSSSLISYSHPIPLALCMHLHPKITCQSPRSIPTPPFMQSTWYHMSPPKCHLSVPLMSDVFCHYFNCPSPYQHQFVPYNISCPSPLMLAVCPPFIRCPSPLMSAVLTPKCQLSIPLMSAVRPPQYHLCIICPSPLIWPVISP